MNEMFTENARKAIRYSQDEASRLKHDFIGEGHILLGLIRLGEGKAFEILTELGLPIAGLKAVTEEALPPSSGVMTLGQLPLTAKAKKALEESGQEARRLKSKDIDTEHVLLGLVRDRDGIASGLLASYGISYWDVDKAILLMKDGKPIPRAAKGQHTPSAARGQSNTLSVIFDSSVDLNEMAGFLAELARLYADISGDEMIVRDGKVPEYLYTGVVL